MASQESKVPNIGRRGTQTSSNDAAGLGTPRSTGVASKPRAARPISVRIGGQNLSIRTTHETNFVEALADHIDQKVVELRQMAPSAPLPKLLMLASMTVAEELFEARQEIDRLRDEITERTETMLGLLDQAAVDS